MMTVQETWSSVLSEFAFWLWAKMDPANRERLTSQAVRGIWIVGCGCYLGKRHQRIRTCLTGEVESPSSPMRRQAPDVKYPKKVERRRTEFRMWDIWRRWNVGGQNFGCEISGGDGTLAGQDSECEISGGGGMSADRIPDVRYPEEMERWPDRIPDVRYPDEVECRRIEFRMWDIQMRWNVGRTEFFPFQEFQKLLPNGDRVPQKKGN